MNWFAWVVLAVVVVGVVIALMQRFYRKSTRDAALIRTGAGGQTVALDVRENELRVQLLGYDPRALKTGIFAVSGVIAGLSGVLFACWAEIVTPGLFSLGQAAETIIWVIAGGLGTWIGPVIGAFALGMCPIRMPPSFGEFLMRVERLSGKRIVNIFAYPVAVIPMRQGRCITHGAWAISRADRHPVAVPWSVRVRLRWLLAVIKAGLFGYPLPFVVRMA